MPPISTTPPRVVVCGAGIVGCSTAFYLTKLGARPVVVERDEPAGAASGKAGGFLALDWNDQGPVRSLARCSYKMHSQLAQELKEALGTDVGYREVDTLQVAATAQPRKAGSARRGGVPEWVDGNVTGVAVMGSKASTAQVHPRLLTKALLEAAVQQGATLRKGVVQGVTTSEGDSPCVTGVIVDGEEVPADAVVIAMGPWSGQAAAWLPVPAITGQRAHSVVLQPDVPASAHCLFTSLRTAEGKQKEPEIYPRPDGTVYVCGESDGAAVPDDPADVAVRPGTDSTLQALAGLVSSSLAQAKVEASQACYLPLSPDGVPVIGAVPGVQGAYIATGHSCWGILNGPATGLAMAELVVEGRAKTVDLSPFSPSRFFTRSRRSRG